MTTPTLTSVTGALTQGSVASLNGSGFGDVQGQSAVVFGTVDGQPVQVTPSSWSDGLITANIPANADIGAATSYFTVIVVGVQTMIVTGPPPASIKQNVNYPLQTPAQSPLFTTLASGG